MKISSTASYTFVLLRSGWITRAGWFIFSLLAMSLALSGISPLWKILRVPCAGADCMPGQLTPADAQAALAVGNPLILYGSLVFLVYLVSTTFLVLVAAALIWRKPTQPAAVAGAFLLATLGTSTLVQIAARNTPALSLAVQCLQLVQLSTLVIFFGCIPDGRFRPGLLRWVALGIIPAAGLYVINGGPQVLGVALSLVICAAIAAGVVSHYRASTSLAEKQQFTWVITAILLLAAVQLIGLPIRLLPMPVFSFNYGPPGFFWFYPVFGLLLLIAALTCLAVALLGDELFRADVAINRAIVYGLLSLFIVGGYVLLVGYLSLIFQSSGSLWFSLVATGVIAALFQPLRQQVQRFVNRIIYGERDDPYTVISQLGQRLEAVIAPDEVIPVLLRTIREVFRVSSAAITLVQPGNGEQAIIVKDGDSVRNALTLPLLYTNETVGWLHLGSRPGENSFSAADRRLLDGLARQAGAAIHAARQNTDLRIARERLVLAQEDERRRIQRDLHDGLGASLAALNMQAGEVQRLMSSDPESSNRRMVDLRAGLRGAIGDTRRLVYGLRPPALDELGLLGALRSRMNSYESGQPGEPNGLMDDNNQPLALCLEAAEQLPPLPAAVEVAIYRIVDEGLANIVRHAMAKNGLVKILIEDQGLVIEVIDDGIGLPEGYRHGVGLHSMRERTVELGGKWSIQSKGSQGTRVYAWLPLTDERQRGAIWTKPASSS